MNGDCHRRVAAAIVAKPRPATADDDDGLPGSAERGGAGSRKRTQNGTFPLPVDAALVQAYAIAIVLSEPGLVQNPSAFLDALASLLPPLDPAISTGLATVRNLLQAGASAAAAARALGTSTFARESMLAALWTFLAAHDSFREAISAACLLGGDIDSICALVGSLAGALHGAASMPTQWIANMSSETPRTASILALAERLIEIEPA